MTFLAGAVAAGVGLLALEHRVRSRHGSPLCTNRVPVAVASLLGRRSDGSFTWQELLEATSVLEYHDAMLVVVDAEIVRQVDVRRGEIEELLQSATSWGTHVEVEYRETNTAATRHT